MVYFGEFLKIKASGQTVLPDRSVLIGQKLLENAKIHKFNCDILGNFQTFWFWMIFQHFFFFLPLVK